jgi:hypothetical protein
MSEWKRLKNEQENHERDIEYFKKEKKRLNKSIELSKISVSILQQKLDALDAEGEK